MSISLSATSTSSNPPDESEYKVQRFDGRRIIVTGAGSGIGQATVARLLEEGGTVQPSMCLRTDSPKLLPKLTTRAPVSG